MFVIVSFIIYMVIISLYTYYKTKKVNLHSQDGYFLAGRSLTAGVIASSILLANLSTEQVVGEAGQVYMSNMGPIGWEAVVVIAIIITAKILLPKYLGAGISTIPEFLEIRFDTATKRIVSILFLLGYVIGFLPTVLYSGALAMNQIFKINELFGVSEFTGVIITIFIIAGFGAIFAVIGGLKAAASADTINGIALLVGIVIIPIFTFLYFGDGSITKGIHAFLDVIPAEKFNAINPVDSQMPMLPWPVLLLGVTFNHMFYWGTNQLIIQRAFGATNLKEAQKGVFIVGIFKLLAPFLICMTGLFAFAIKSDLTNADLAYPMLIMKVLPKPLLGFFAATLFGAILGSYNGALNSSIAIYTLDIYKPIFNKNATDEQLVKKGRIFGFIITAISAVIAPFLVYAPSGFFGFLQGCFAFYSMPILAAVIVGVCSKKVPSIAAKVIFLVHVVLYSLSIVLLPNVHYMYVLSVLFPLEIVIMLIIGKMHPRENDFVLKDVQAVDLTSWKYIKPASVLLVVGLIVVYIIFSPLGLARA